MKCFLAASVIAAATTVLSHPLLAADQKFALKDEPRPSNIRLQETDLGVVFADSNGMTLYTDTADPKLNTPACTYDAPSPLSDEEVREEAIIEPNPPGLGYQACLLKHRPVEVGDAKPVGPWTVFERDGKKQWAYRGHPVYTSIKDMAPGQAWADLDVAMGQYRKQFVAIFAPLDLPPDLMLQEVGAAKVFATFSGRTLYTLAQDRAGKSTCEGACLEKWQPFVGGVLSQSRGDWSLVQRTDGRRQWALHGKPLYMYAADRAAGDTKGNNLPGVDVAVAYPAPRAPSFITMQTTPVGDLYADENGKTLYSFICPGRGGRECDDAGEKTSWWFVVCGNAPEKCADVWKPVLAKDDAKPAGNNWTIVNMPLPWSPVRAAVGSSEKSVKVWAFKGRPLFTYTYEDHPGMIDGMDVGTRLGPRWYAIYSTGADLNTKRTVTQAAR